MADLNEAFSLFDRDNDGKVSAMDMEMLVRSVGYAPSEMEMHKLLGQFDKGSGDYDLATFKQLLNAAQKHQANEQELSQAFKVMLDIFFQSSTWLL